MVSGKLSQNHSSIMVRMASSPAIVVCTVCHMYSLSISVSSEEITCDKCREIVRLTEKIV